jgi:nucleotide-binding universal stress UspA family protein
LHFVFPFVGNLNRRTRPYRALPPNPSLANTYGDICVALPQLGQYNQRRPILSPTLHDTHEGVPVRILLAIDGSPFSDAAIHVLATQIRPEAAEVLLVHVIEGPAFFEQDAGVQERHRRAEKIVSHAAQEIRSAGFQEVLTRVVEGEPKVGILEVAAVWRPSCIVLGSHGRKGLEKLLLGSVAQSVAQHASCSVFIVRVPPAS